MSRLIGALEAAEGLGVTTVIPRTRFKFHGSTFGVPPPPSVIPLLTRIDSREWTSGVLIVRVHAKEFPSTTSYVEVEVYNDGFTPEDPSSIFTEPLSRALATIPNAAAPGALYVVETAQPIGRMVRVELRFYQGSSNLGVSNLVVSVALLGRRRLQDGDMCQAEALAIVRKLVAEERQRAWEDAELGYAGTREYRLGLTTQLPPPPSPYLPGASAASRGRTRR